MRTTTDRKSTDTSAESPAAKHREIDLGSEASFVDLPSPVSLGGRSYYLVRGDAGYKLLSTVCPHQGGEVVDKGLCFECPHHGWQFERDTGKCINAPTQHLSSLPVVVRNSHLYAEMPVASPLASIAQRAKRLEQLSIQLHAHACLEIVYKGFSLLTDPWLEGPAFLGSWTQYPPSRVKIAALRADAILISHEHSDHFSEATLKFFDRLTPIYVPDFPNRRLIERLTALGFSNVHPLAFGHAYQISENCKLTCYEPESLWNDAIVLIEVDDFRLLNINDAGLNRRIAAQVAPVDVVAAQFSTGASGYPLTWSHLTESEKIRITERARQGKLQMLKEALDIYGGEYLLPFASHFMLWHPSHRKYISMLRMNTIDDVVQAFAGSDVRIVDLLPGETWDVLSGEVKRVWRRREKLYDHAKILKYLERRFDAGVFERYHSTPGTLSREMVAAYFLRLNQTAEIAFCEDLTVQVRATTTEEDSHRTEGFDLSFEIAQRRLRILPEVPEPCNLLIEIPLSILKQIITENLSWDEAFIGYWCRFTRTPDVYHAGFWRLLQAPYFKRPAELAPASDNHDPITSSSVIAGVIENYGDQAERILRRYGLYCAGCQHSTSDSIAHGAKSHGVQQRQVERIVEELNQTLTLTR